MRFVLVAIAILLIVAGLIGAFYWTQRTTAAESPVSVPTPIETAQQSEFIKPLTLKDIRITVIRLGLDVTLLLDWEHRQDVLPFHLWIEVEGGNVTLLSPNNEPRTIEVVPEESLILFGSNLYHEREDNRLAIDLQVKSSSDEGK